jgi:hypothetical protein
MESYAFLRECAGWKGGSKERSEVSVVFGELYDDVDLVPFLDAMIISTAPLPQSTSHIFERSRHTC